MADSVIARNAVGLALPLAWGLVVGEIHPMKRPESSCAKTWRDWHEVNAWLFPHPSELAEDPGPVGQLFRRIPEELLRDADRCPDPWRALSTNRFLMDAGYPKLFRACASVLPAAIRLARTVYSRGDLVERAKGGTSTECEVMSRKLFPGMWRAGARLLRKAAAEEGPDMLKEFEEREARLLKMIAKKSGKTAVGIKSDKPTAEALRSGSPIAYLLLVNWLRCGHLGDPGFCFYSDPALVTLLSLLGRPNYNTHLIERMRERLGLLKACPKIPYVTGLRRNSRTKTIEFNTLDAAKAARFEWPKRPPHLRSAIELSGRVLYRGARPN